MDQAAFDAHEAYLYRHCLSKNAYCGPNAQAKAEKWARIRSQITGVDITAYPCRLAKDGHWHIGHRSPKQKKEDKARIPAQPPAECNANPYTE